MNKEVRQFAFATRLTLPQIAYLRLQQGLRGVAAQATLCAGDETPETHHLHGRPC